MTKNRQKCEAMSKGRLQLWYYFAVKKIALLRLITSNHQSNFCCLKCFSYFATKNNFESYKKSWKNTDFCNVIMPSQDTKISEFNKYKKFDKAPFTNYADLECITKKIDEYKNNPKSLSTIKVSKHIPS